MGDFRRFLFEISEVWPILAFIGMTVFGYLQLRFKVSRLVESEKEAKDLLREKEISLKEAIKKTEQDIEHDIKNLSIKLNNTASDFQKSLDKLKDDMHDNHLQVSKGLSEIRGLLIGKISPEKSG